MCQTLWCKLPDNRCVTRLEPAAPGTSCAKHKVNCLNSINEKKKEKQSHRSIREWPSFCSSVSFPGLDRILSLVEGNLVIATRLEKLRVCFTGQGSDKVETHWPRQRQPCNAGSCLIFVYDTRYVSFSFFSLSSRFPFIYVSYWGFSFPPLFALQSSYRTFLSCYWLWDIGH